jgi:hypothetical protein
MQILAVSCVFAPACSSALVGLQTSSNRRLLQVQLVASKQAWIGAADGMYRMRLVLLCTVVSFPFSVVPHCSSSPSSSAETPRTPCTSSVVGQIRHASLSNVCPRLRFMMHCVVPCCIVVLLDAVRSTVRRRAVLWFHAAPWNLCHFKGYLAWWNAIQLLHVCMVLSQLSVCLSPLLQLLLSSLAGVALSRVGQFQKSTPRSGVAVCCVRSRCCGRIRPFASVSIRGGAGSIGLDGCNSPSVRESADRIRHGIRRNSKGMRASVGQRLPGPLAHLATVHWFSLVAHSSSPSSLHESNCAAQP